MSIYSSLLIEIFNPSTKEFNSTKCGGMNIFSLSSFGLKKAKKELVDAIKERGSSVYDIPQVAVPTPDPDPGPSNEHARYTIGTNDSGNVQLRIALDYGSATLTMNEAGTIELIEQLAFQIRHTHDITIAPIGEDVE